MKIRILLPVFLIMSTVVFGQDTRLKTKTSIANPSFKTLNKENQNPEQKPIVAYGSKGEEIIVYPNRTYKANPKISLEFKDVLFNFLQQNHIITDIEFTPQGGWVIATNKKVFVRNVKGKLLTEATKTYNSGKYIENVEFNPTNWNKDRDFIYVDNTMAFVSGASKKLNFNRAEAIPVPKLNAEDPENDITKVTYTFRFDWLAVFEANDRGIPGGKLDLYGYADLEFWFVSPGKDKVTIRLDKNLDFSSGTASRFKGEVFRIDRDKAVELGKKDGVSLAESEVLISVDLRDFNNISLEDFEKNAYLDFSVTLKESDTNPNPINIVKPDIADDEFPVVNKRLYLKDAPIDPITSLRGLFPRSRTSLNRDNIIKTAYKKDEVGISFSLTKEVE